jgi:signal transduction histidine kinase
VLENPKGLGRKRIVDLAGRLKRSLLGLETLADDVRLLSLTGGSEEGLLARRRPVAAICRDVGEQLAELATAEGVQLTVAEDLPHLPVDASRAELVLVNLVTNGIRHRDRGATNPWVRIQAAQLPEQQVRIEVCDNGPGVAAADRERIFERRERGDATVDGDGLGLAIARAAVEQLGGEIGVESDGEGGSTFWFTVPPVRQR